MRKIVVVLIAVAFSISSNAGMIFVPGNASDNAKSGKASVANVLGQMDAKTFLSLTPAKIQEMTGKKMTLGQKVSLKMAQMEVKKQLKKGKEVNMADMGKKAASGINILWVLIGFVLNWVGVLIAYLTREGSDDNRVKSAWIGFAIGTALWIILWIAVFATSVSTVNSLGY
jgi:hypothetical protein